MTCNLRRPAVSRFSSRVARLGLIFGLALPSFLHPATVRASGEQLDPRKPYALIFGTVWGPDDRPAYGVKVKIRRADQKRAKWELHSNHTGEFAQRLPAGKADYVVWADTKGWKSLTGNKLEPGSEVAVHIEFDERADVGLHLK